MKTKSQVFIALVKVAISYFFLFQRNCLLRFIIKIEVSGPSVKILRNNNFVIVELERHRFIFVQSLQRRYRVEICSVHVFEAARQICSSFVVFEGRKEETGIVGVLNQQSGGDVFCIVWVST